jgi:hypothetical protein
MPCCYQADSLIALKSKNRRNPALKPEPYDTPEEIKRYHRYRDGVMTNTSGRLEKRVFRIIV